MTAPKGPDGTQKPTEEEELELDDHEAQADADAELVRQAVSAARPKGGEDFSALSKFDGGKPIVRIGWVPFCSVMEQTNLSEQRIKELITLGRLETRVLDGTMCVKPEGVPRLIELDRQHPFVAESSAPPVTEAPPKVPENKESVVSETKTAAPPPEAPREPTKIETPPAEVPKEPAVKNETKSDPPPPATPPKGHGEKGTHSVHSRTGCEQIIEFLGGEPVIKNNCVCGNCRPVQQVVLMPAAAEKKDDRAVVPALPPHDPKGHGVQFGKNGFPWIGFLILIGVLTALLWVNGVFGGYPAKETANAAPAVTKVTDSATTKLASTDLASVKQEQDDRWQAQTEKNSALVAAAEVLASNVSTLREEVEGSKVRTANPSESSVPVVTQPVLESLSDKEQAALVKFTLLMKFCKGWAEQVPPSELSPMVKEGIASISGFPEYPILKRLGAKRILAEMRPGQVSMEMATEALKKNGIK